MRSFLRFISLLLLGLNLAGIRPAQASHALSGSLTYKALGNSQYRVRCDMYRDCSGIVPSQQLLLQCVTACGGAATTATLLPVQAPPFIQPFNNASATPCQTPNTTNVVPYRYEGNVTLSPNQWTLAVQEGVRPNLDNLTITSGGANQVQYNLRLEATLDNRTQDNNSVDFSALPIFYVPYMQPNLLHIGAFDVDGDSLSYELARPLDQCGVFQHYAPYLSSCTGSFTLNGCTYQCPFPAGPAPYYSAELPISVAMDTVGACPNVAYVPRFQFDPQSGAVAFTPSRYVTTNPYQANKYAVVVKVTEWRRLTVNGVRSYVAIGTTRRDMVWVVYNAAYVGVPRLNPTMQVHFGPQISTVPTSAVVPVKSGEPIAVRFTATSPIASTLLSFSLEQNTVPGANITNANGQGELTFTPPLSLPDGLYRVSLTVTDTAYLRNIITVPITFQVYSGAAPLAVRRPALQLAAFPNPFTEQVRFQLAQSGIQELRVTDRLGRTVARVRSQPNGWVQWQPGPEIPAGLYLARTADGRQIVRLLRQ